MIKKLIEKLYFKCYPDRKDAYLHSLEPVEMRVVHYPIKTIGAQVTVDTAYMDQMVMVYVEKELARKLSEEVLGCATIEEDKYSHPGMVIYRATLDVAVRDRRM